MITFVVPIKSTRFTKSEEALGVMVAECVSSCLSVIGSRVIVVCNPSFAKWVAPIAKASNKVDVIVLPETELPYGDEDKGEKMFAAAMRWLKYYEPTSEDHFMPVDCDDLIASDIWRVAFHGKSSVLNVGYLKVWNRVFEQASFWYRNGSSHILSKAYVESAVKDPGSRFLYHLEIRRDRFAQVDRSYVIRRIGHGENIFYVRQRFFKTAAQYALSTAIDKDRFLVG